MNSLYTALRILLFLPIGLLMHQTASAQVVPDNVYFIPLPEPQLQTAFKNLTTNPLTTTVISNTISVNISIVATSNKTIIYYDHWEDGYQANFSGTRQNSTQVWGDNDPSNGIPPGYATDIISAGDRINLLNNVSLPRSTSTIVYDGRDKIASTRFLAVTRVGVPTAPGSVLGSAVEVYDTTVYDQAFQLPIGETTDLNAGSTCCLFEYTSIFVMAREDATTINLDINADGVTDVTATLNQGESYHFNGTSVGDVLAGAMVTSNKPVQVDLVTGDIGATYESRTFAMYPTVLWDNCYYNPVGRTTPNADVNAFIFNPGPTSLTINAKTTGGISTFTVGPKATYRYNMPDNSGAHFYTTNESDRFFAVGVHDADITEQSTWDWGFSLLPEVFLSTAAVVGYGPGTSSPVSNTGNGSPVWVLATQATTLYVDYDGDPTTGALTDPNGSKYDVAYPVIADQSQRIFDNNDRDQTGIRVYTLDGTRIAVAWGEDAAVAGNGLPFLDLGTTVTPERKILISKRAVLTVDNGQAGIVDPGDEITYQIIIENSSLRTRNVVSITDTIPTGLAYVAGSARRNRTTIIPDQSTPNTPFPLDETGYALGDLILNQKDTLSFRVTAQRPLLANATVTNRVTYNDSRDEDVSGQVTVSINQNYPPTANRDDVTTPFNTSLTISILGNDVDKANRPAALTNVSAPTITTQPKRGTATINGNGVLTYVPNNTFAGRDTLIYRICDNLNTNLCDTALVTITIQSAPPTANRNDVTTAFNQNVTINILANDIDKASRPAALTNVTAPVITSQPKNGSVIVNGNGSLTYNPDDTFAGRDTLIYRICDNVNTSLCDTALVTILIQSAPPTANPNPVTTAFNTSITIPVLGNDVDKANRPAALTNVTAPIITQNPANGAAVVNANGSITYTPINIFAGTDVLIYRLCDNINTALCDTALVTIRILSAPPTANPETVNLAFNVTTTVPVLANDVDKANRPAALTNVTAPVIIDQPNNGVAVVNGNGTITYNPNDAFAGLDTLQYRICDVIDPSRCDTTFVAFNVGSQAPNATPDVSTTPFNVNVTVPILGNDTDRASQPASLSTVTLPVLLSGPVNGSAIINSNGTLTYNPNDTFAGVDTVRYRICDNVNTSLCTTALVTITVQSAPPTANRNDVTTAFNTNLTITVLGNDVDKANRPAALTNVTNPVIIDQANNGLASVNGDGSILYNPNDTFAGRDTLIYRICDNVNNSLCDTALVTITIQSAPPTANRNDVITAFNTNITIAVLGNDVDKANRPAALTNVSAPVILDPTNNGLATVNPDGSITYDPINTFAGRDTLIYQICDNINASLCDTALVTILIQSAPPTANRDEVTTAFNTNITFGVVGNDIDRAGRPAALTGTPAGNVTNPLITAQPKNGSAIVNANGSITYDPVDTFAGRDTLIYQICDLIDPTRCDTALAIITIQSAPPTANRDDVITAFNTNITITVLGNDVDKASRPAALTNVTAPVIIDQPNNGSAVVNGGGTLIYNPNDTFAGRDTLIYRICDNINASLCDTALVTILIQSAPPTANRNDVITAFNTNITITVLGNDVDKASRPATLTNVTAPVIIDQPNNGSAMVNGGGTLIYNPNDTFAGRDTLIYQICDNINASLCDTALVTILIQSAPPTANRNDVTTAFNTNITIAVLGNDVDKASRPATLTNVSAPTVLDQPANGGVVINPDGSLTYNPDNTFAGRDTLVYQICDLIDPAKCDTALVTILIQSAPPTANPDVVNLAFNQTVSFPILNNDVDKASRPATLTLVTAPVIINQPANGTASIHSNGTVTYNPNDAFAGTDVLTYRICDLIDPTQCDTTTVTFNVGSAAPNATADVISTPFNQDVAILILANDADKAGAPANLTNVSAPQIISQPANGTAQVINGVVVYNPNNTFAGIDVLTYRICDVVDPTKCDSALVTINVISAPPLAQRDDVTTPFNTTIQITVLGNDVDKANRPAALTNVTAPAIIDQPNNGVAVVNPDGTVLYNPNDTFAGRDTLLYRICDNVTNSFCDTTLVTILIQSAPPVANGEELTTAFNTNITIAVLTNDTDKASQPATLTLVSLPSITRQPTNGVATVNPDGTIFYNPADTFAGTDTLIYRICDVIDPTQCDTARVTISIQSAPPFANPDQFNVAFNVTITVPVLANDADKANRPASLTNVTIPQIIRSTTNGQASATINGTITYDPNNTFAGADSLLYRICDNLNPSLCDTTLTVFIVGSAPPMANQDITSTPFRTPVTVTVLGNDVDKANRPADLTFVTLPVIIRQPASGSALVNTNGTVTYSPTNTFAGRDTLSYRICDTFNPALCDTALVIIDVLSAPPVANRDSITTAFNTDVTILIISNDVDKTGQPASLSAATANVTAPQIVGQPAHGLAFVNLDGSITYNPANTFAGRDTLVYQLCDTFNSTLCDTALVTIIIRSAPPVAVSDAVNMAFNATVTVPILTNDTDKASRPASLTNVTIPQITDAPNNGTAIVNSDGTLTYTPTTGFAGPDTLRYRICDVDNPTLCDTTFVVFSVGSSAPNATPDIASTPFNTSVLVSLLANDADRASQPATVGTVNLPVLISAPLNGTAFVNPDGTLSYSPASGFAGNDTLQYRICDVVDPSFCDTAQVVIAIGSAPPVANRDEVTTPFNTSVAIPVLVNDTDKSGTPTNASSTSAGNVTVPIIVRQPAYGQAIVDPTGIITIVYDPGNTFAGRDTLIYQICDRIDNSLCDTALVTINVLSAPPVAIADLFNAAFNTTVTIAILANDTDKAGRPADASGVTLPVILSQPANGTALINVDGTLTYNPNDTFAGRDTLVYRICDITNPSLCDTTTVIINVGSMAPNAVQDAVTTPFNTSVTISVLANDTDRTSASASLTFTTPPVIIAQPGNGSASVNASGAITYTPNTGFAGSDTLQYRICDLVNSNLCDTALVVINVGSAAPTANLDAVTVPFNTTIAINVLANDLDRNGQPATTSNVTLPVIIRQPASATTVVRPNGTVVYDPLDAFAGPDTLVYRICDPVNPSLCDSALVIISVSSAPPIANNDQVSVPFNSTIAINVLANDLDRAGQPATVATVSVPVIIRQPTSATTVVTPNGIVVYDPLEGVAGNDTLIYRICDNVGNTLCDTAFVYIFIGSTAPVAAPDAVTTAFNTSLVIPVLGNDIVLGGRPASLSTVSLPTIFVQPAHGTVAVNQDGTVTYTPTNGFAGTDIFLYRICDLVDPSLCVTAQVTIQISAQECPDMPVCLPVVIKKVVR